jgi:hypothetical protein
VLERRSIGRKRVNEEIKGKREGALSHYCIDIFLIFSLRELIVVLELLGWKP